MERAQKNDYDWLLKRNRTAYEILSIYRESSPQEIKKAYRQQALRLHPDKNNAADAEEQFREISVSYKVLSDLHLKSQYDAHIYKKTEIEKLNKLKSVESKQFKDDLLNSETLFKNKKDRDRERCGKLETLRKEFEEAKRLKLQQLKITRSRKQKVLTPTKTLLSKSVRIKWKNKQHLNDMFNAELIKELLQVFGEIEKVVVSPLNKPEGNYHYAVVLFSSEISATLASTHDYSKTADYWDNMGLRKLSSLLRAAKLVDQPNFDKLTISSEALSFDEYISLSILKNYDYLFL